MDSFMATGTLVNVKGHKSAKGKGLSYNAMRNAILMEDCNGTGWDVVTVKIYVPDLCAVCLDVYSFDVTPATYGQSIP